MAKAEVQSLSAHLLSEIDAEMNVVTDRIVAMIGGLTA